MLWNWELDGSGVTDPLKAMDRAFATIEKDIAAVDDALQKLEKRQQDKAALADMSSALGRKGAAALQAPDVAAFGKREPSEQFKVLEGATAAQAAAYRKTVRDFEAQMDRWAKEREAKLQAEQERQRQVMEGLQHRSSGFQQLKGISDTFVRGARGSKEYEKGLKDLNKQLAELERKQRLEQVLSVKDPTQRHIELLRYQRDAMSKTRVEADKSALALGALKFVGIGLAAYGAAKSIYGLAKSIVGLAIAEGGERRSGIRTLEVMLGNKKAAEEQWETIELMSDRTKVSTGEIMNTYRTLFSFTQKYGAKATQDVIAASEDINVVLGESAKGAFISVIRNMEAMDKFDERSIRMLKQVGVATPEKVYKALAEQRHMTEAQVKKLMSTGKIGATEGINTLLSLVQKNLSKGALGAQSASAAMGSVPTQLKNIERAWGNLFDTLDTKPIARALADFGKLLDPTSETGAAMGRIIKQAFDDIVVVIDFASKHMDTFTKMLRGALETAEFFANLFSGEFGKAFGMLGVDKDKILAEEREKAKKKAEEKAGTSLAPIKGVTDEEFQAKMKEFEAQLDVMAKNADTVGTAVSSTMTNQGAQAAEGYASGIESKQSRIVEAVMSSVVDATTNAVSSGLKIQSPSRVMEQMGVYTGQGFQIGIDRVGPPDLSAMMDLHVPSPRFGKGSDVLMPSPRFATAEELSASMAAAAPVQPTAPAPTPIGASKSVQVDVEINVMPGANATVAQQWAEIQPQVRAEFVRLTESLAEED